MRSSSSAWASWSEWTAWETAAVTQQGTRAWVTDGVLFEYDVAKFKSCQFEMQVRSVGEGSLALLQGPVAGESCTVNFVPTIVLSDAAWSPEGLDIPCACDYSKGVAKAYVTSLKSGGKELLARPVSVEVSGGMLSVPQSCLAKIPGNGASVAVTFCPGTDQVPRFELPETQSVSVSYGTGMDAPDMADAEGMATLAKGPSGARMWCVSDTLRECRVVSDDGESAEFEVLYPLGVPYDLFMATDGGTWHASMPARGPAVHAWNWEGGSLALECRRGDSLETGYSIKADYEAYALDSRPRESVRIGRTFKGAFTAAGSTVPGKTASAPDDAVALQEAGHVVYRSPNGWVRDVAVTSVDVAQKHGFADVTVSMIEEAV